MSQFTIADLAGDPRRVGKERRAGWFFSAAGWSAVAVSALIVTSLLGEAWSFISDVDLSALWGDGWFPRRGQYDIKTLFVGSVVVTAIGLMVAVPLGLGAAVYLSEYASRRVRRVVKPVLEILAGIPSVVVGFFALTVIGPDIIQRVFSSSPQQTLLSAGLGVGILVIPIVASVSEDAMAAVPNSLREASYGMGARKITTVVKVVLPAAVSGLVAALIIAISRGVGETMVVFIAAGKSGGALFEWSPLEPGLTMTAGMASVAAGTDSVAGQGLAFQSLFFVGLLLFLMTLGLNVVADRFVRRVRQSLEY